MKTESSLPAFVDLYTLSTVVSDLELAKASYEWSMAHNVFRPEFHFANEMLTSLIGDLDVISYTIIQKKSLSFDFVANCYLAHFGSIDDMYHRLLVLCPSELHSFFTARHKTSAAMFKLFSSVGNADVH